MLTLFGMVLAIGIVVDDAIVVVENVERNMASTAWRRKDAAKQAMDEIAGPVVAIVLVLCAVFMPVAFLGGVTGQLYKQFAITIAISVVISGRGGADAVARAGAIMIKAQHGEKKGFFRWFDTRFERLTKGYMRAAPLVIKRVPWRLLLIVGMVAHHAGPVQARAVAFLPVEDQGYIFTAVDHARRRQPGPHRGARPIARSVWFSKQPAVKAVATVAGFSLIDFAAQVQRRGRASSSLKGFAERQERGATRPMR